MDRNLALEFVRVTESAAISCSRLMGRGERNAADQAAVDAMRNALNDLSIDGTVVIGEGERDEAPMLYIGEPVGRGGIKVDIALDPLEGTNLCATGGPNALAVLAVAEAGGFLHAPDTYMDKIAVGPEARGAINILKSPTWNLEAVAKCKGCKVEDLTVIILERPRHEALIREVREAGARIRLISDGDVSASLATCWEESGIDLLLGIGGAPEGVLSAAALRSMGGDMQAKLCFRNDEERVRAKKMGVTDLDRVFSLEDLAKGDVLFAATGVTNGEFLKGVDFRGSGVITTESVVMRSKTGTVRYIRTEHHVGKKPFYCSL